MFYKKTAVCLLMLSLMLVPVDVAAQKKQITQARDYIKSGKNLDKAESILREQLADSSRHENLKIWDLLVSSLKAQYEQGNEQLYLKQKYDTLALFNNTYKLFMAMEAMDSIDARPDKSGNIHPKYRQHNAAYLSTILPNLYYGGVYLVGKKRYDTAYSYFDHYINAVSLPLLSKYVKPNDKMRVSAAYWTMYCGYKLSSDSLIMRHHELAERDTTQLAFIKQYEAEAYAFAKDTANYVKTLREGFIRYPKFPFFFPRLMDYYGSTEQYGLALDAANEALAVDSTNGFYRVAKSTVLLNMGQYEECIDICDKLIEQNDQLADAYYNAGLAYFNMAVKLDKVRQPYRSNRQKMLGYYKKALPYMEKYRELAPDMESNWISPLYTIYLNLNMGQKFDEIDKLQHEYRKNHK